MNKGGDDVSEAGDDEVDNDENGQQLTKLRHFFKSFTGRYLHHLKAVWGGHTKTVQILLRVGADVNIINKDGKTALMIAKEKYYYTIVELLIEAGAKE